MKTILLILPVLLAVPLANSCAVTDPNTARTRNSVVMGGVAGGVIGNNTGLGSVEGALIGGIIGGVLSEVANNKSSSSYSGNRYHSYNNKQYQFR